MLVDLTLLRKEEVTIIKHKAIRSPRRPRGLEAFIEGLTREDLYEMARGMLKGGPGSPIYFAPEAAVGREIAAVEGQTRQKAENRQRLFVDMDGTVAVFTPVDTLETLYQPGYFRGLEPIRGVVEAVKRIIRQNPEIEVFILSSYLSDSAYALAEKNAWLDEHLPGIDAAHRIFSPCGENKVAYVPGGVRETDFLLDDYTHNLRLWPPPARGIKLLNGINHTRGTWEYDRVRCDKAPDCLARDIVDVMKGGHVMDSRPQAEREMATAMPEAFDPVPRGPDFFDADPYGLAEEFELGDSWD